jgi:hypothetical protein
MRQSCTAQPRGGTSGRRQQGEQRAAGAGPRRSDVCCGQLWATRLLHRNQISAGKFKPDHTILTATDPGDATWTSSDRPGQSQRCQQWWRPPPAARPPPGDGSGPSRAPLLVLRALLPKLWAATGGWRRCHSPPPWPPARPATADGDPGALGRAAATAAGAPHTSCSGGTAARMAAMRRKEGRCLGAAAQQRAAREEYHSGVPSGKVGRTPSLMTACSILAGM